MSSSSSSLPSKLVRGRGRVIFKKLNNDEDEQNGKNQAAMKVMGSSSPSSLLIHDLHGWKENSNEQQEKLASSSQGLAPGRELQAVQQIWNQLGADIDGEAAYDNSGNSVSLSDDGTVVAVGAPYNDGNGSLSGHVRVYKYLNNAWTQLGTDIDGEAAEDYSAASVSLSSDGTVVAVGALGNDGNGSGSGHVRVYKYLDNGWTQLGDDIDGEAAWDLSGHSVSLSGDGTVVAVGAPENGGNGSCSGHVRVYKHLNNAWIQLGTDIDGEAASDYSGRSVSLSVGGTVVAVGAYGNDGNGSNSGHVRVYKYLNNAWIKLGDDIDGEAAYDNSGFSVSLSSDGTVMAVGAYLNNGNGINSGHVRVYEYLNNAWTQLGNDIDGAAACEGSGRSVSLSSDGTVVAVGAPWNGDNSIGHVRIYKYLNNAWTQLGTYIDGEAAYDYSGYSVSLSGDGTVVAVGAYGNNGNGYDSGHVRVFSHSVSNSSPSFSPTNKPTTAPTNKLTTSKPTNKPTTSKPTNKPTTSKPTNKLTTATPTNKPTSSKPTTAKPTNKPTTSKPTNKPTTAKPTNKPTTATPTNKPTTAKPTNKPSTTKPTNKPTSATS